MTSARAKVSGTCHSRLSWVVKVCSVDWSVSIMLVIFPLEYACFAPSDSWTTCGLW